MSDKETKYEMLIRVYGNKAVDDAFKAIQMEKYKGIEGVGIHVDDIETHLRVSGSACPVSPQNLKT